MAPLALRSQWFQRNNTPTRSPCDAASTRCWPCQSFHWPSWAGRWNNEGSAGAAGRVSWTSVFLSKIAWKCLMVALTFLSRIPTTSSVDFLLKLGSAWRGGAERCSVSGLGAEVEAVGMRAGSGWDWSHKNIRSIDQKIGGVGVNGPFSQVSLEDKLFCK